MSSQVESLSPVDVLQAIFFTEAWELIADMEQCLLAIEQDPADQSRIDQLFRAAHTLKGSAGVAGVTILMAYMHQVETFLDRVRNHQVAIQPEIISTLLGIVDCLGLILKDPTVLPARASDLVKSLMGWAGTEVSEPQASAPAQAESEPTEIVSRRYRIRLAFHEDLFDSGTDPLMFIDDLANLGNLQWIQPLVDSVPPLETLDPFRSHLGWEVILESEAPFKTVEALFKFVGEHPIRIQDLGGPGAFDPTRLASLGLDAAWWPLVSDEMGQLLLAAPPTPPTLYRLHLAEPLFEGPKERLFERLEGFACIVAHRPLPAANGASRSMEVLAMSTAEPSLFSVLLGKDPLVLEVVYAPEGSAPVASPWGELFTKLTEMQQALYRSGHPRLKETLGAMLMATPSIRLTRSYRILADFAASLEAKSVLLPERRVLRELLSGLLEAWFEQAVQGAEMHVVSAQVLSDAGDLLARLQAQWNQGGGRILADISEIRNLEGGVIEKLVDWTRRLQNAGGGLALVHRGPSRNWLSSVIGVAGFERELPLWSSMAEGLQGFGVQEGLPCTI